MTKTAVLSTPQRIPPEAETSTVIVFGTTLFLSAALLFSLQPMFAKMAPPTLGGMLVVWAVSTCFFQAICSRLLLRPPPQPLRARAVGALVHAAVLAVAFLALPIGLPQSAANPPPGGEYLWPIGLLASGVGLPFFAISATAPPLQAWFTRSASARAADRYFLYGASNVGSLLALVSDPFLIEPMIGLSSQSSVWVVGFATLAFLIAVCAIQIGRDNQAPAEPGAVAGLENSITWRQRLHWIACAFIPSGLLVAFTSFVTTDVASAPSCGLCRWRCFSEPLLSSFATRKLFPGRAHRPAAAHRRGGGSDHVVLLAFPLPIAFGVGLLEFLAPPLPAIANSISPAPRDTT